MVMGRIPRFSPSFSPAEMGAVLGSLVRRDDDDALVSRFEEEFARTLGVRHAVMVPSARYGFYLLLRAMGVEAGDQVLLPALTYWAIPSMALAAGVEVGTVDIGLRTHVMDPEALESAITDRTRAVVPTHLFGTPCDMPRIMEIARRKGVKVIEDTAQAMGARIAGRPAGTLGDASYYTFGLTKNMTTLSGAMISTDHQDVADFVRGELAGGGRADLSKALKEAAVGTAMMVATHPLVYPFTVHPAVALGNKLGKDPIHERFGEVERRYDSVPTGYRDSRPRAVQAAVGLRQLSRLDRLNGARARNGRFLDEHLANVPGLVVPEYPAGAEPIYMSFVVHHPRREALAEALRSRGVDTTIGYMSDISSHPLFPEIRGDRPRAREAFATLLHLPVHPNLRRRDLDHLVEAVRSSVLELNG